MHIDNEQKIGMIVPNGKHIRKAIMDMLDDKGYEYDAWQNGLLHVDIKNEPMSLTFQHQVDVIGQVSKKVFAGGYVGSERLAEHFASLAKDGLSPQVVEIGHFRLFKPRLRHSFLVRDNAIDNERYKTPADLRGTRIVTGTPTLAAIHLALYLPGEKLPVDIDKTNGGEEGQVYARVAEAALVVVDSGDTMRNHFLRELKGGLVMRGIYVSAIANIEFLKDRGNRMLLEQAMSRLQNGRRSKTGFLMPNLPGFSEEVKITPVVESVISPERLPNPDTVNVSENGHEPNDIIVPEQRLPWYTWFKRLIPSKTGSTVVLSTLPLALLMSLFTLPNPSAILKSWHSGTSKEKDLRS